MRDRGLERAHRRLAAAEADVRYVRRFSLAFRRKVVAVQVAVLLGGTLLLAGTCTLLPAGIDKALQWSRLIDNDSGGWIIGATDG